MFSYTPTTTPIREQKVSNALAHWFNSSDPAFMRLTLALEYLRQAHRLASLQPSSGTLTAEVVLNLVKAIEVLFGSSREAVRKEASTLGIDQTLIEERIIPLMLVRNELDVGHTTLRLPEIEEIRIAQDFAHAALASVEALCDSVVLAIHSGKRLRPISSKRLKARQRKLLVDLADYLSSQGSPSLFGRSRFLVSVGHRGRKSPGTRGERDGTAGELS